MRFDLLEHNGADLRDLPLINRKQRLARLLGRAKRQVIHFNEHLADGSPNVTSAGWAGGHCVEAD